MTGAQKKILFSFYHGGWAGFMCMWLTLWLEGPGTCLMLWNCWLEILNHFWAKGYAFSSGTRLANYVVCPERRANVWRMKRSCWLNKHSPFAQTKVYVWNDHFLHIVDFFCFLSFPFCCNGKMLRTTVRIFEDGWRVTYWRLSLLTVGTKYLK